MMGETAPRTNERLGAILRDVAGLSEQMLDQGLARQADAGGRIGEILVTMGAVSEDAVYQALSLQSGIPYADAIDDEKIELDLIKGLSINYVKRHEALPLERVNGCARIAVSDPLNFHVVDDLRRLWQCDVAPVLARPELILEATNKVYDRAAARAEDVAEDLGKDELDSLTGGLGEPEDLLDSDDEAPIIRLVNSLLFQAVKDRASDIHIEPFEKELVVRFRIDGVLYEIIKPPKRFQNSIVSRVKVMAGLNIAEKRLPQDGRIRLKVAGRDIDIRLSTVPTSHGERVVMRLLNRTTVLLNLEELGFSEWMLKTFESLILRPYGIILVTGPTGSGKTTTLYAALSRINTPTKNIITVEDPVEYQIEGLGQIQVNPKINLTFAEGLRSIVRQDPDVIMVGEIRDAETADIAINAALTGHLVFSTVHTNDAPGAVTRLIDMGVEPFLISSSVVGVMAQRLVRVLCPHCREAYTPTQAEADEVGLAGDASTLTFYRPTGCDKCAQIGYLGRCGIYELMLINDDVRKLIVDRADASVIRREALKHGMVSLRRDGALKVQRGLTSIAEVLTVTQLD